LIFTRMVIAALTWGAGRINATESAPKQPVQENRAPPRAA
jgi:hypothetical protein